MEKWVFFDFFKKNLISHSTLKLQSPIHSSGKQSNIPLTYLSKEGGLLHFYIFSLLFHNQSTLYWTAKYF